MNDLRTAAQQALEALEQDNPSGRTATITALRAALAEPVQRKEHCLWARNGNEPCPHVQQAEPVQEPVATKNENGITLHSQWDSIAPGSKLYTAPPQRKPLTEEEITQCWQRMGGGFDKYTAFARAVEAAHGIGGEG